MSRTWSRRSSFSFGSPMTTRLTSLTFRMRQSRSLCEIICTAANKSRDTVGGKPGEKGVKWGREGEMGEKRAMRCFLVTLA